MLAPDTSDGVISTLTSPDVARLRSGEIRLSAEQKDAVRALYRAEVASVDASVGRVLERLDRLGLRERTLVICVADHGEEFWEHGGVEHGHTLYDELLRVPLVMRWPGRLPAGTRVEGVTRITDVAPTLLELLRLPAPETARDGTSLLPLIDGTERTTRVALSENLLFAEERLAIRTRDQKYIRWESGKEETYDLTGDPGELRDLAGVLAFVSPLRKVADAVEGSMPTPSQAARTTSTGGSTRALRALGYVQ